MMKRRSTGRLQQQRMAQQQVVGDYNSCSSITSHADLLFCHCHLSGASCVDSSCCPAFTLLAACLLRFYRRFLLTILLLLLHCCHPGSAIRA
jgi:hypothetical protein